MSRATLYVGDVRSVLATLEAESVQCVVTSPPYWGLRDYGVKGQLGLESTPGEYVENMVQVFREVRRVLRKDGVVWLNLGDSYATNRNDNDWLGSGAKARKGWHGGDLKPKDLCGIPWRAAFALQADGWWLRSDVIWAKPNPMPESVTDRPTRSHEYLFLLTKSSTYWYDAQAIAEESLDPRVGSVQPAYSDKIATDNGQFDHATRMGLMRAREYNPTRNARSVWTIATNPYPGAHFATFPEELARRCILAGSSPRACEHCGAPWERTFDKGDLVSSGPNQMADKPSTSRHVATLRGVYGKDGYGDLPKRERTETGWKPTCSCENNQGTGRSVVLDPFGGSGTVAQVATGNGRDSIYIDLNPKYRDLARQRIGPILCTDAETETDAA